MPDAGYYAISILIIIISTLFRDAASQLPPYAFRRFSLITIFAFHTTFTPPDTPATLRRDCASQAAPAAVASHDSRQPLSHELQLSARPHAQLRGCSHLRMRLIASHC
jgi:hypothetical protein